MIALRAGNRRAGARRPAVESAVTAGDDGRPDATLGKPALRKAPLRSVHSHLENAGRFPQLPPASATTSDALP